MSSAAADGKGFAGQLRAIWVELLGPNSDDGRSFYELGGDSLQAITLIYEIEQQLGVEVALVLFLEDATLPGLTRQAETARDATR